MESTLVIIWTPIEVTYRAPSSNLCSYLMEKLGRTWYHWVPFNKGCDHQIEKTFLTWPLFIYWLLKHTSHAHSHIHACVHAHSYLPSALRDANIYAISYKNVRLSFWWIVQSRQGRERRRGGAAKEPQFVFWATYDVTGSQRDHGGIAPSQYQLWPLPGFFLKWLKVTREKGAVLWLLLLPPFFNVKLIIMDFQMCYSAFEV